MSIFGGLGGLGGLLEGAIAAHPGGSSGFFGNILGELGGLQGIADKLNQSGLGPKVSSWLGAGPNQPLTAEEIQQALSPQHLQQIAAKLGIPEDQVAAVLAKFLPQAIDQASPQGTITT